MDDFADNISFIKNIINDLEISDETKSTLICTIAATFAVLVKRNIDMADSFKLVLEENAATLAKIKSLIDDTHLELKSIQFDLDMTKIENQELRDKLEQP